MIRRSLHKARRGAALLTVLVAMMIISIMLFEFQYASMVERKLAYNDLNALQAYYLAKSGARMGLLRVSLYGRARKDPNLKSLPGGADLVKQYLELIWNLPLPPFPPDKTAADKLVKADKDAAEKTLAQTKVEDGQSTHVITTEASKINLNHLVVPVAQRNDRFNFNDTPKTPVEYTARLLINLIEGFIRDSENPYEEYGNIKPEEIVFNIMDWVTPGNNSFAGGTKDNWYEQQKPPYKAKRNRLYTIEELRLVRGIDSHLFDKLRPHITVYSYDGKINLNTASTTMIRALYRDFSEDDVKRIQEEKDRMGGWISEKQFVDYVASTLGRSAFKTFYATETDYPFTVSSQSFLIDARGVIKKSRSEVGRSVKVGVALTTTGGGSCDKTIDQATCNSQPGRGWHLALQCCVTAPKTDQECLNLGGGRLIPEGTRSCCKVPNTYSACVDTAPQTAQGGAKKTSADPNAMKILYWVEN